MRAAFRADASAEIGSGHIMRCCTLAGALRRRGVESLFLCRAGPGHPGEWLAERGFAAYSLPADLTPAEDAAACAVALRPGVDFLVVDHYSLDQRWERAMQGSARIRMAIDDLANRAHDCDLLLDQNLAPRAESRYAELVSSTCTQLLGPTYALLRDEFHAPAAAPRLRESVHRVLVSFGGSAPDNLTEQVLREIENIPLAADVVIGNAHSHRSEIERRCRASAGRWTLHVQTSRMAELMARADLALGAGGSTHWERCRMGLPALVVAVADNQIMPTQMLADRGACLYLGESRALPDGAWRASLAQIQRAPDALRNMSRAALGIVPAGNGADRVAARLMELAG